MGQEGGVRVERQIREIRQRKELHLDRVVSCLQRTPDHRCLEPDADGELGGVVKVRCHPHDVTDLDHETRLLDDLPGGSGADILAVVEVTAWDAPEARTRGRWPASDHQNLPVFDHQPGDPDGRVAEMHPVARRADLALPAIRRLDGQLRGAVRTEGELPRPE